MKYVNVVVDNNTDATDLIYTYACEDDGVLIGQKVKVPFSIHNREADAYVVGISDTRPEDIKKIKKVRELDPKLCLNEETVRTALWMRNRCLCRYIEAIKCFLPPADVKGKTKDPLAGIECDPEDANEKKLNPSQKKAKDEIGKIIDTKKHDIVLLHGVTGSGKTEVYLQLMKKVIDEGRTGIMLVPEISLTPQLVSRFMRRFGKSAIAVIHSRLTKTQRASEFDRILSGEVRLVIGARSAAFAPLKNIGLIVMDEEHETSYKSDMSPKYDTLELVTKRSMDHNAVVVLGSATPSVTDYYRSEEKIFRRIELPERYNKNPLPKVSIVDMTKEVRSGNRNLFSAEMVRAISECLEKDKQVILFLNRRGYSSFVSCRECGFVLKCADCGIAMPYHKDKNACVCHYCGRTSRMPNVCPKCGSKIIGRYGVGTQQVEEKTAELFPDAKTERLDMDSIRKKGELEAVLKRFAKKKTDILIGTQIVAKGLDFDNVGLVGVISADVTLNIPDFRASERTFQLVTQAAGRAGRGDEQGRVIIQTYSPESAAVLYAAQHNYKAFYDREISIRRAAAYPPFSDIFQLMVMDESPDKAMSQAQEYAAWLREHVPKESFVLGPSASALQKQNGMYRYQLLIKSNKPDRKAVCCSIEELKQIHEKKGAEAAKLLTTDINPFSYI